MTCSCKRQFRQSECVPYSTYATRATSSLTRRQKVKSKPDTRRDKQPLDTMAATSQDDVPLRVLFNKAQLQFIELAETQLASTDPKFLFLLEDTIKLFAKCLDQVEELSLFSANETKDDVNTGDLRYLLVEFYLGELIGRLQDRRPGERERRLNQSRTLLSTYLTRCESYELMAQDVINVWRREGPPPDPAQRRQDKIDQFKREKELKARLEPAIAKLRAGKMGMVGRAASDEDEDGGGDDDEETRVFITTLVEDGINQSMQLIPMIDQELEILKMRPTGEEAEKAEKARAALEANPPKPTGSTSLRTITLDKESIRAAVFQMRNQPTMTIEEFADMQIAEAREREGRQAETEAARAATEALIGQDIAGSSEVEDAKQEKDRKWDDWKDENPKGMGNTKFY